MVPEQKTALILGASGLTGQFCLKYLLESNYYQSVIALVRQTMPNTHPKLKQVIVDFDNTSAMEPYYDGVDDVFCCLGTTIKKAGSQKAFRRVDFHIPTESANIASGKGVKQFIVISCTGAYNRSSNFYLRVKGEMEAGISQFGFEAIHIFRPSLLLGDRAEARPGESFAKFFGKLVAPLFSGSGSKIMPLDASTVAQAMVNVAQLSRKGKFVYSTSQIQKLFLNKSVEDSVPVN